MNSKSKIKKCFIAVLAVFVLLPMLTFAAGIRVDSKNQEIKSGEQFIVTIYLNTEESVNAIEGQITFPYDLLELKEIQDGNSIINFWIEKPKIETERIFFSGIIPGGFQSQNGLILSMLFQTKKSGHGSIIIEDIKVLKNDGLGASAETTTSDFRFVVSEKTSDVVPKKEKDYEPPETFRPEVARDTLLFDGKWFVVFSTQDKSSGIDHYEIRQGLWSRFYIAESPYLLQNQKLDRKIFVKAVDKNSNERIEILYPPNFRPWYKNGWILAILMIIGTILITYIVKKFYGKNL